MSRLLIVANRLPDHRPPHARWRRGGAEHRRARHRPLPTPRAVGRALDRLVRGAGRRSAPRSEAPLEASSRPSASSGCRSPRTTSPATTRATPTGCSGRCSTTCSTRSRSRSAIGTPTCEANERFADVVAAQYRPGDLVWVHDYQLLLLPGLLRAGCRTRGSGSSSTSRFPPRSCSEPCRPGPTAPRGPARRRPGRLSHPRLPPPLRHRSHRHPGPHRGHRPGAAARPRGAARRLPDGHRRERRSSTLAQRSRGRGRGAGAPRRWERADPGGGRPARLHQGHPPPAARLRADARRRHPELREKVRLVQVAVPSRTGVEAYQDFRSLVDELVGRINGAFGTPRWVPVHYIFRGLSRRGPGRALPRGRRDAGDARCATG